MTPESRSQAIAAAVIMAVVLAGFYFLPVVMLAAGDVSPYLGLAFGIALFAGFFVLFWLRARHQRRKGG